MSDRGGGGLVSKKSVFVRMSLTDDPISQVILSGCICNLYWFTFQILQNLLKYWPKTCSQKEACDKKNLNYCPVNIVYELIISSANIFHSMYQIEYN